MLELHHRIERKKTNLSILHLRAFTDVVRKYVESGIESKAAIRRSDILKLVNHGVRAGASMGKDSENLEEAFTFFEIVKGYISMLTPRELTQIFPIDKTYDGDKWETKDYFYTMRELRAHGMDTPIGEWVDEMLWDYMNHTTRIFNVNLTGVIGKLHREQTGIDPFESFMREQGVPVYRHCKDPETGSEFIYDAESGRTIGISPAKPRIPSYLNLVQ